MSGLQSVIHSNYPAGPFKLQIYHVIRKRNNMAVLIPCIYSYIGQVLISGYKLLSVRMQTQPNCLTCGMYLRSEGISILNTDSLKRTRLINYAPLQMNDKCCLTSVVFPANVR